MNFRGRLYGKKAQYPDAVNDLTKSIEIKPNFLAFFDRAQVYENMGENARAVADYSKALELDAGTSFASSLYASRAAVFMASGDYNSAVADCTKALDADPAHVELADRNSTTAALFNCRAKALLGAGNLSQALHDSEHSLELWPGVPAALCTHGRILKAFDRRDEAIAEFQRALTNSPDYGEAKASSPKLGGGGTPKAAHRDASHAQAHHRP